MRSPWKKIKDLEPRAEYLVLTSATSAESLRRVTEVVEHGENETSAPVAS